MWSWDSLFKGRCSSQRRGEENISTREGERNRLRNLHIDEVNNLQKNVQRRNSDDPVGVASQNLAPVRREY
jgi:hypothetical protein